jgi:general secretion pathway protein N
MVRLVVYIVLTLVMTSSNCLHAQDQPRDRLPNEPLSALPGLNLDSLSATRERPLFAPDRRKPAPPPVAAVVPVHPQAAPQPPQQAKLELTGVIVSPLETIVLLRDPATSESVTVHPGEKVGRWLVSVDANDNVTLKDGVEVLKLEMYPEP